MLPAYPAARLVPAHPSNFRPAGRTRFECVVIHCTDGHPAALPVAEMWQTPGHGSSAHFVVGQDGAVIQAVRLDAIAFHAHTANTASVGVEHCARTPRELGKDDPGLPPSDVQYVASARLVAWLLHLVGLPATRGATVLGHAEADAKTTHQKCPDGCGWDWPRYMALVEQELAALKASAAIA